jgi:hypothetical protein
MNTATDNSTKILNDFFVKFHIAPKNLFIFENCFRELQAKFITYTPEQLISLTLCKVMDENPDFIRRKWKEFAFIMIKRYFLVEDLDKFLAEQGFTKLLSLLNRSKQRAANHIKKQLKQDKIAEEALHLIIKTKEKIPLIPYSPPKKTPTNNRKLRDIRHQMVLVLTAQIPIELNVTEKAIFQIIQTNPAIFIDQLKKVTGLSNIEKVLERLLQFNLIRIEDKIEDQ